MNATLTPPTLAGFAAWLEQSAQSLTEAAGRAATAGDPARGRQIYSLAQFLGPIGQACRAFAAGHEPELDLDAPAVPVQPEKSGPASEALARCQRDLAELAAGDSQIKEDLVAIRARIAAHDEATAALINRLNAELAEFTAGAGPLKADLIAIRDRVAENSAAKAAVIDEMTSALKALRAQSPS